MKIRTIVLWGFIGGIPGGVLMYFLIRVLLNYNIQICSLADWIMIIATVSAICFGYKGIMDQIKSQNDSSNLEAQTYISLSWTQLLTINDSLWSHGDVDSVKDWNSGQSFSETKALPTFSNVGEKPALDVDLVFTFYDKSGNEYHEIFGNRALFAKDSAIIVLKEWESDGINFAQNLIKLELFYKTIRKVDMKIEWTIKVKNGSMMFTKPHTSEESEPDFIDQEKWRAQVTKHSVITK